MTVRLLAEIAYSVMQLYAPIRELFSHSPDGSVVVALNAGVVVEAKMLVVLSLVEGTAP